MAAAVSIWRSGIVMPSLAGLVVLLLALPALAEVFVPDPDLPADASECVAPTDVMRREHMKLLMHQRSGTVHEGIRSPRFSLAGCVECHAGKDAGGEYLPVNAPGQFCAECHSYAAVKLDCFQCHATRPDQPGATALGALPGRRLPDGHPAMTGPALAACNTATDHELLQLLNSAAAFGVGK